MEKLGFQSRERERKVRVKMFDESMSRVGRKTPIDIN